MRAWSEPLAALVGCRPEFAAMLKDLRALDIQFRADELKARSATKWDAGVADGDPDDSDPAEGDEAAADEAAADGDEGERERR